MIMVTTAVIIPTVRPGTIIAAKKDYLNVFFPEINSCNKRIYD
jgi:hypothetical protein